VRKALSMAIDRHQLVKQAFGAHTFPADATGLGRMFEQYKDAGALEQGSWVQYNPETARQILEKHGLVGSDATHSYTMIAPEGWDDWYLASQLIVEQLAAVGIKVTLVPVHPAKWRIRISNGEFELSLGDIFEGTDPYESYRWLLSPRSVRPIGESAPSNWHRFGDAEADAFLQAIEMTRDKRLQTELYRQVQLRFVQLAPAIPLAYNDLKGAINTTRITGFPTQDEPYAPLAPYYYPDCLLVLTNVRPR